MRRTSSRQRSMLHSNNIAHPRSRSNPRLPTAQDIPPGSGSHLIDVEVGGNLDLDDVVATVCYYSLDEVDLHMAVCVVSGYPDVWVGMVWADSLDSSRDY